MAKYNVGDTVKVARKMRCPPGWAPPMDDFLGKTYRVAESGVGPSKNWYRLEGAERWLFNEESLDGVRNGACILTEKVTVNGVPCRKILGFEGILGRDELPNKYWASEPRFALADVWYHRKIENGVVVLSKDLARGDGELNGISFDLPEHVELTGWKCQTHFCAGDIIPEKTFQELLVWLKRAGSRLAKIRVQEKAAWSGKETVEI